MVHAKDLDLDFEPSVTVDIPFDGPSNFADDDLAFGWLTPPESPRAGTPDIFDGALLSEDLTEAIAQSLDKYPGFSLESLLHGVPVEAPRKTDPKTSGSSAVWWNGLTEVSTMDAVPPLHSFCTPPASPTFEEDVDFHAFVRAELGGEEGLFAPAAGSKRKHASAPVLPAVMESGIATKRARLQAHRAQVHQSRLAADLDSPQRALDGELTGAPDCPERKRQTHNILERKRREDLKHSYQVLRHHVPELVHADRAPTGQILAKASEYIAQLKAEEARHLADLARMRRENQRLHATCSLRM